MAFQQPLVPVFPVARELITKTKWFGKGRSSPNHLQDSRSNNKSVNKPSEQHTLLKKRKLRPSPSASPSFMPAPSPMIVSTPLELQDEPEEEPSHAEGLPEDNHPNRSRMLSMFRRRQTDTRNSVDSNISTSVGGSIFSCGDSFLIYALQSGSSVSHRPRPSLDR